MANVEILQRTDGTVLNNRNSILERIGCVDSN